MFSGSVEQLKARRATVERAMSRWRSPAMATALWAWMEHIENCRSDRKQAALEEARILLAGESEATRKEKQELQALIESEKDRRQAQARRMVRRMLNSQLAGAFDHYHSRILEVMTKRETCRRVVLRMRNIALSSAFELLKNCIQQLLAHHQMVSKAMARWRVPILPIMFDAWHELVEEEKACRHSAAQQAAMDELKGTLEQELDQSTSRAQKECERRMEMCKRVVARMGHIQLANSFDTFADRVREVKDKKVAAKRTIFRMLHTQLAAAFDCFTEAVEHIAAHRNAVSKTISRWRAPLLPCMFSRWLVYMDQCKQAAVEDGHALAKQQLSEELAKEKSAGETRMREEQDRRIEQARRIVCRLLHAQVR